MSSSQKGSERVVIGMDPHKRTVTIEVMTPTEEIMGRGRFTTDEAGFEAMLEYVRRWPHRTWAIEGREGIGRHVAQRLVPAGEDVVDVPAKLSARMRVYATGQGRKTDDTDAHSIALVGVRMAGLHTVAHDEQLEILRLLVDRRRRIGADHTRMVCQLHALLLELIPGGAKRDLSAAQARKLLATVRPKDAVGRTRKRVALELVVDLERVYARKKAANKELVALVPDTGTARLGLHGTALLVPPACSSRSATSPASPTRATSPPGPAPPRSTRPPGTTCASDCPAAGTGTSTRSYTSWPPSSCAPAPPRAGPTTTGKSPPGRPRTKPCAA
jgi:hypothetical protein